MPFRGFFLTCVLWESVKFVGLFDSLRPTVSHLEGVILARSSPTVSMTRLPHIQSPMEMPTPPYSRIQIGVNSSDSTSPVVAVSQMLTNGPMALLETYNVNHVKKRVHVLTL